MNFPELSSLRLYPYGDFWFERPAQIIPDSIRNARKLRQLTIGGNCQHFQRLFDALPWTQITHFTAEKLEDDSLYQSPQQCSLYDLLPRLTNVQHFSIEVFSISYQFSGTPIILPQLHTLVLLRGCYSSRDLYLAFGALTLPALRNLQIISRLEYTRVLIPFLDRSRCQLEELELIDTYMCPEKLVTLLQSEWVQGVRKLKILGLLEWAGSRLSTVLTNKDLLQALRYPLPGEESENKVVLPNPVSLTLSTTEFEDKGELAGELVEMIASRRHVGHLPAGVARLRDFTVQGIENFSLGEAANRARFKEICEDGLVYTRVREDYSRMTVPLRSWVSWV